MIIKWIVAGAVATGATATIAVTREPASPRAADLPNVTALLEAMRGTGSVACALAMNEIEGRNGWGRGYDEPMPGVDSATVAIRKWLNEGIEDPAVVAPLKAALGPGDPCVRQTAARLLGRTKHPRAVTALAEGLKDPDAVTRQLAALGLGMSDSRAAYDPLVAALRDQEPGVRAAAATALGHLDDHRASAVLLPLLTGDRVPMVRQAAAYALGHLE
jgi:hypothetical protein